MTLLPASCTEAIAPPGRSAIATLAGLLETAADAYLLLDGGRRVAAANAAAERLFGAPRDRLIGRAVAELLAGFGSGPEGSRATAVAAGWAAYTTSPLPDGEGTLVCARDVTLDRRLEQLQQAVLEAMVREQPLDEVLTALCREVERLAPEVVASILAVDDDGRLQPIAGPSLPATYVQQVRGIAIGPAVGACGTAAFRGEPVLSSDIATDPLWAPWRPLVLPLGLAACWSSPIHGRSGRVAGTFAFYYREPSSPTPLHRRIVDFCVHLCALAMEREEARARLHRLAFFDPLCGLPNRALLHTLAERAIADAGRAGQPLAALVIDLDRFKLINEARGHAAGDALLREIGRRLSGQGRASDIVGRLAGDEFVVLLPRSGAPQAALAAERLLETLAAPVDADGLMVNPSASVGIAIHPEDGHDIETLLRHADIAMTRAKADGRGSFRFFRAEMNASTHERMTLEVSLREALKCGGLRLHYQPKVAVRPGGAPPALHGAEALLRWTHPTLGPIAPDRVIALAEDCGLIGEIGRWVLGEACSQLADWRRRGIPLPHLAVNLSARNFRDAALPSVVAQLLQRHRLAPEDLTLEVTESVMLDADSRVLAIVQEMHALGVPLSLDDFGTGYSSLAYLHRLPIRELKIDKSFVRDLGDSATARALVHSMLRIGESLGLTVVAEGVETAAQRDDLAASGCPVQQGYHFARPMPAAEFEAWIARRQATVAAPC